MKTAEELLTAAWLTLTIYPARESTELVRQQIKEYLDAPKPEPKKPMTEEEIKAIVSEASKGAALRRDGSTSTRIVRAVERHHGIGGGDE